MTGCVSEPNGKFIGRDHELKDTYKHKSSLASTVCDKRGTSTSTSLGKQRPTSRKQDCKWQAHLLRDSIDGAMAHSRYAYDFIPSLIYADGDIGKILVHVYKVDLSAIAYFPASTAPLKDVDPSISRASTPIERHGFARVNSCIDGRAK